MECPYCKAKLTVRDTDALTRSVMRIRRCPSCGYRCETTEEITLVLHPAVDEDKKQRLA